MICKDRFEKCKEQNLAFFSDLKYYTERLKAMQWKQIRLRFRIKIVVNTDNGTKSPLSLNQELTK